MSQKSKKKHKKSKKKPKKIKRTKKRTSGKTRKRRKTKQQGGGWWFPWRRRPTEHEMAVAAAQAIRTKDPGLVLTLSGEESTDEQRPDLFLKEFIRPHDGEHTIIPTKRLPIRIPQTWINYFFTRWKDNKWKTSDMTREQRNEFNRVGIRIKKHLSKEYGCEQLDLIFQEINDIISDTVDETWSLNEAIVEQYRSEGLSDEDITKGIELSVLQGLEGRGMDIRLREKVDDGGGIYIPSLNLCISGHEIREIYAPHLAEGQKVRKEVKGMKVKALKKRAKEIGIDEEQLVDVDYREDVKVAIITLILKQIDHPPEGISEDIWRKVKRILQADDYVNEEVMKINKLYDELKEKTLPLPPNPEQTQEKIESYEKMMKSWWRPYFKKYF